MISKKLAATLGTGTLGASGAAGTAAWQYGLFEGVGFANEIAEVNQPEVHEDRNEGLEEAKQGNPKALIESSSSSGSLEVSHAPQNSQIGVLQSGQDGGGTSNLKPESPGPEGVAIQENHEPSQLHEHGSGATGGEGEGVKKEKTYFSGASDADKEVIDSNSGLTWEKETSTNKEVTVKVKNNDVLKWQCTLRPVIVGTISSSETVKFDEQAENLIKAIKGNEVERKKFVENCSRSRTEDERTNGNTSEISLETEKSGNEWKFKNFKNLREKDVERVPELNEEEKKVFEVVDENAWKLEETKSGKEGKVKISVTPKGASEEWICSISGTYSTDLNSKTFKDDKLKNILKMGDSDDNREKKKYIIRNCAKNNKNIVGLDIQDAKDGKWEFKEFRKITQAMYTNPTGT